jgi:NADH-quinone oxidoreductase subunit N
VTAVNFDLSMFLAILPEILLVVLVGLVLVIDLILPQERKGSLGWVTASGLVLIMVFSLIFSRPPADPRLMWGGMLRWDWLGFVFTMLFLFGAAISSLLATDYDKFGQRGEFYVLLLVSTLGMCFMASSADMIMLYLAIETTSIPLYILAGLLTRDDKSTEAGFKYLLFGAMTSAVMLYGFSLLYGFSGTTNMYLIAQGVQAGQLSLAAVIGSLLLVLIGFGFKVSAVPLHFWAPDVYEGAPTPVTGFLSTASKAAGFAVLIRFLLVVFPSVAPEWRAIVAALSVATMTLGNLLALAQTNIKRMLAYSSIAHAGYILIGLVAVSEFGASSVVFYLVAYLLTNMAAFGVVAVIGRVTGSDEMTAYYGLSRRAPGLSLMLMVAFLSLAGMPPLGGFVAKFFVFAAAVNSQMIWLAVVGVLNSIIGLYYYLTVLKYVYLYPPPEEGVAIPLTRSYALALGVLVVGIILIGTIFGPWFNWATAAASALF